MTNTAGQEKVFIRSQQAFDTLIPFSTEDSVRHEECGIEGGLPEIHPSAEMAPAIRKSFKGNRQGSGNLKLYQKAVEPGIVPPTDQVLAQATGKVTVDFQVTDYTAGAGSTVVFRYDGVTYTLTEGAGGQFQAVTSNAATATNIRNAARTALPVGVSVGPASGDGFSITVDGGARLGVTSGNPAAWNVTARKYELSANCPRSLQIMKTSWNPTNGGVHEVASGVVSTTVNFVQEANDEGRIEIDYDLCRKGSLTGLPRTDTAGYANVTTVNARVGDVFKIYAPLFVKFVKVSDGTTVDNAGNGFEVIDVTVTDKTTAAGNLTLGTAVTLDGEAYHIQPVIPAYGEPTGTETTGLQNGAVINGTELAQDTNKFDISLTTGLALKDPKVGSPTPTGLQRGQFGVDVSGEGDLTDTVAGVVGAGAHNLPVSVALRQGPDVIGRRIKFDTYAVVRSEETSTSMEDPTRVEFEGFAEQQSTELDQLVVTMD